MQKSVFKITMSICNMMYIIAFPAHAHAHAAKRNVPQENQAHTAQNQRELPKEQLKVDLRTWDLETER